MALSKGSLTAIVLALGFLSGCAGFPLKKPFDYQPKPLTIENYQANAETKCSSI